MAKILIKVLLSVPKPSIAFLILFAKYSEGETREYKMVLIKSFVSPLNFLLILSNIVSSFNLLYSLATSDSSCGELKMIYL